MENPIRRWAAIIGRIVAKILAPAAILITLAQVFLFAPPVHGQPNIVLITLDDAGYNDFGFMAALNGTTTDVETPNLDALAQQSVVMSSGYVTASACGPSRAGLLLGQYQQRYGYETNLGQWEGLAANDQLISDRLKALGYTTGAIGKWHLGQIQHVNQPLDMGFDEFFGFFSGGRTYWDAAGWDQFYQMRRGRANVESQWVNEGDATRYDPVKGRYATDAFGEEAVGFINRHAGDENPFFLYFSPNAPHEPLEAKQEDLDRFPAIADPARRALAAMTYAMDRAVGDVLSAIAVNGLADETIVVFTNDNGGPNPTLWPHENFPFNGAKGGLFEGGIRVPFMIKAPGLAARNYDSPVSTLDLTPTFVAAAGGNVATLKTDGVDLMPFLRGEESGEPHEILFWREENGKFAVRQGPWKLVRAYNSPFPASLYNIVDDISEQHPLSQQYPEIAASLLRELTLWEAALHKSTWNAAPPKNSFFDHFLFRNDVAPSQNWSTASAWKQAGTNNNRTLFHEDAYANAILEFTVRNDANYTATNNMSRSTGQTFMLNQMRFTGSFSGAADRSGTINGNALLLVKNLDGQMPQIRLDATAGPAGVKFTFQVTNELQLLDDLELTGDGTQQFVVSGNIRDYYEPRNVIKSGASSVTLAGNNTFGGALIINEGRVRTSNLTGDVANNGGIFAPGASPALTTVGGSFVQSSGVLEIEIGGTTAGTQFDKLVIAGAAQLGDRLDVQLINGFTPAIGQMFEFLTAAGGVTGTFDVLKLPKLSGATWTTFYDANSVSLQVSPLLGTPPQGDFNGDGVVDAADHVTWRKAMGAAAQYDVWRANYGQTAGLGVDAGHGGNGSTAVPEPSPLLLLIIGLVAILPARRKHGLAQ